MKKKNIGLLFYLVSAVFNVIAIVSFASKSGNSLGFAWLCLGSTFLCLGTAYNNKAKKEADEESETSQKE